MDLNSISRNTRSLTLHNEALLATLALTLSFAFIYPELFLLTHSPMGGDPTSLKDPAVSWSAFMPAFRDFRYELLEHGNLLWSNLRGMGQPMLGNTVQGAPLFPLNLVLLPLPDSWYWSVMPISRIILIGLGCFLVARRIVGLSFAASFFFALLIAFNINTVRWMNHPTSNGLLAGIWYFYFACRLCLVTSKKDKIFAILGFSTGVFSMITTGFPEAAAMSALLFGILFIGFVINKWRVIEPRLISVITMLITCHIVGFCFSAIQIFSLIEFIDTAKALDLRSDFAGGSYQSKDLLPYSLAQLSFFGPSLEHRKLLTFSMGLWGLFFAIRGMISLLSGRLKHTSGISINALIAACVLSMGLFIIKAFGLSELIKELFLATPILAESHFPLYFSPLFFFCFALISAVGFHDFLSINKKTTIDILLSISSSLLAIVVVITISALSLSYFHQIPIDLASSQIWSKPAFWAIKAFVLISLLILILQASSLRFSLINRLKTPISTTLLASLFILATIFEINNTVPKGFYEHDHTALIQTKETSTAISKALSSAPLPQHELRGINPNGDFVAQGLASADNGISAILTPEIRLLRRALFNTPYGGYVQLKNPIGSWSYHALSANMLSVAITPPSTPEWKKYSTNSMFKAQIIEWPNKVQILTNPFTIKGRSSVKVKNFRGVHVWLHFQPIINKQSISSDKSSNKSFWVKAENGGQRGSERDEDRFIIDTKWHVTLPAKVLEHNKYRVLVRQVADPTKNQYHDTDLLTLNLDREAPAAAIGNEHKLLATNTKGTRHVYFDSKALPRAYIANKCEYARTIEQELNFYRKDDAVSKGAIIFPYNDETSSAPCENYSEQFKRVSILDDDRNKMRFENIQGPALLQVNDSYYPGWSAYQLNSEGKKTSLTINRANTNGRSIYLPESKNYSVIMEYRPFWLKWVYILFVLAIVILGWMILLILRDKNGESLIRNTNG